MDIHQNMEPIKLEHDLKNEAGNLKINISDSNDLSREIDKNVNLKLKASHGNEFLNTKNREEFDETQINNPWAVGHLEEFLYYCCPECDERNQSKALFVKHALGTYA